MGLELDSSLASDFLSDVISEVECIRESSSIALCKILESDRDQISAIIFLAMEAYQEKLHVSLVATVLFLLTGLIIHLVAPLSVFVDLYSYFSSCFAVTLTFAHLFAHAAS